MAQLRRQRDGAVRALQRAIGESVQPPDQPGGRVARDARVRSELKAMGAVSQRLEALDALLEMFQAAFDVARESQARADHQMRVHAHGLVALGTGQIQELVAERERLVELG